MGGDEVVTYLQEVDAVEFGVVNDFGDAIDGGGDD